MGARASFAVCGIATLVLGLESLRAQGTPPSRPGPTFDVVSIRRNVGGLLGGAPPVMRPDGGLSLTNVPVSVLIGQAFGIVPADMEGLPSWVVNERYDVRATSTLDRATPDDRRAMLRAMLADRFQLSARTETRVVDAFDLVLARSDGRLGPGLKPATPDLDCAARAEARRVATEAALAAGNPPPRPEAPSMTGPVPPCTFRLKGSLMEGEQEIANLANMFRGTLGRPVVDKTGLKGGYLITLEYDRMAGLRGPSAAPVPDGPPAIFTAVVDQLGLRLLPSKAERDVLVIERLERPSEN